MLRGIKLTVTLDIAFVVVMVRVHVSHLHRRLVVRGVVSIKICVYLISVNYDWLIRDISFIIGLLNAILSLCPSLSLLCILALLLAPLDEDIAKEDETAAANNRTDNDGALTTSTHIIAAIAIAVAVAS